MKTTISACRIGFVLVTMLVLPIRYSPSMGSAPSAHFATDSARYTIREVMFLNPRDSVSLYGTLTLPKTDAPCPAVVLVSGSGPQNRDSELLGHKPFAKIARYLSNRGVAVLRVDDRGAGQSGGRYNEAGLDDFIADTQAAVEFVRRQKEIDNDRVGLIGHSLGATIAVDMAAEPESSLGFIVLLAGSGMRGDALMLLQKAKVERAMGVPELGVVIGQNNFAGLYELIVEADSVGLPLRQNLVAYLDTTFGAALPHAQKDGLAKQFTLPWFFDFVRYDPADDLASVRCPVLVLGGENDVQVPTEENFKALRSGLDAGGNVRVEFRKFPGLNHLFQESTTGLPDEYAAGGPTMVDGVLKAMGDWILGLPAR